MAVLPWGVAPSAGGGQVTYNLIVASSGGGRCSIVGNTISNVYNQFSPYTIYLNNANNSITGNTLTTNLDSSGGNAYAIYSSVSSGQNTIVGNMLYNGSSSGANVGIYSYSGRDIIDGNFIYRYTTGITIPSTSTNAVVTSNITNSCTTAISDTGTGTVKANNTT